MGSDFHEIGRYRDAASIAVMNAIVTTATAADASSSTSQNLVTGFLDVGDGHHIYYEQCGVATGLPVLFLHGGPGSGSSVRHRDLFDLTRYRITLLDQRGCGRSLPRGSLEANTSAALIADIEQLRHHLGIERWLVFGGSWGAGLALAYAAAHREACLALVLRGVFLGRPSDLEWFFQQARQFLPEAWAALALQAPEAARHDLLSWLSEGLHGNDPEAALSRAVAWQAWESSMSQRQSASPRTADLANVGAADTAALLSLYRVQSHYLTHGCFWGDTELLARAQSLASVPTAILHGRLDWICRPQAAWDLHHNLPGSRLQWLEGCGHSPFEAAMSQALAQAMAHFLAQRDFAGWGRSFTAEASA